MPAHPGLFQQVLCQINTITRQAGVRVTSTRRLALLVTGLLAAQHAAVARIAAELAALHLTRVGEPAHLERRLRRTLNDHRLEPATCYHPVLRAAIDWRHWAGSARPIVLLVDESSKAQQVHLFRVSLSYRGSGVPLAWAVWEQNGRLPAGTYWREVDGVLEQVAGLLPSGVPVLVLADRAFDIPAFVDRIGRRGWHWIVRAKAQSQVGVRLAGGREVALAQWVHRQIRAPGMRAKMRCQAFKRAGWREVSLVAHWAPGQAEPLAVLTDLPPRWEVLARYGQRFWIEAGFRSDKKRGWQWEASGVRGVAHNERLLLAMAWASLVSLRVGAQEAQRRLDGLAARHWRGSRPAKPEHARQSLFTLGLRRVREWAYHTATTRLPARLLHPEAKSWSAQWYAAQSSQFIFQTVRP